MTLAGFTERVSTTEIRYQQSIGVADFGYNDRYVEAVGNSLMARVKWKYDGAEQTIDEGRMMVVKAVTADLESVEEVSVSG